MLFAAEMVVQKVAGVVRWMGRGRRLHAIPPLQVSTAFIGDMCVGKTAILVELQNNYVDNPLHSKLCISMRADDPRGALRERQRAESLHKELSGGGGLASTISERCTHYVLYEGDKPAVELQVNECVGQALAPIEPPSDNSRLYERYQDRLYASHVVWLVVRCPPEQWQEDETLRHDISLGLVYLRAALAEHAFKKQRVSVVILVTKIDAVFDTAKRAQQVLTESLLRQMLWPLIALMDASEVLNSAVIMPVSALGFPAATGETGRGGSEPQPAGGRQPFNLQALMPFSILHGILPQEVDVRNGQSEQLRRVATMLEADIREVNPWMCRIR